MENMLNAPFLKEMCEIMTAMYRLGWNERNGGNISLLLDEAEVAPYIDSKNVIRRQEIGFAAPQLAGRYFLATGSGKYFRNTEKDPETNLGLFRVSESGTDAEILWGLSDGGKLTSELPAHLMTHMARLETDPCHRVVTHCHPPHVIAMTSVHELSEAAFTRSLWGTCSECIMIFPDGVGLLPWMLCGTNEIGSATAEKMREFRIVVWALHGIYAAGRTLEETFGLIETVEKAAQLYMLAAPVGGMRSIPDEGLVQLADKFCGGKFREDFLGR